MISSLKTAIGYNTNGTQKRFPFPYALLSEGYLEITLDDIPVESGYTVTLQTNRDLGAVVEFTTAPAAGQVLVISRATPITQTEEFVAGSNFDGDKFEGGLDKITMIIQERGFVCGDCIPLETTVLAATANGTDQIDLTWNAVVDPSRTGYELQRSLDGETGWITVASPAADDTSASNTGLDDDTTYYYRIRAVGGVLESDWSNTANATTDLAIPDAPSSLVATEDGTDTIDLTWTDNSDNETSFIVQQSPNGTTGWVTISTPAAEAEADSATGLAAGTQYFFRVAAVNAAGTSAWSNTANATTLADDDPWESQSTAGNLAWTSVAYGNGVFVAVDAQGLDVATSPDGITWTLRTAAADRGWRSVTFGNGLFVAVADSGTGDRVMTSPDGITWTLRTSAADNDWQDVTYGGGLFVAVSTNAATSRVMTSPDGITWTLRTTPNVNISDGIAVTHDGVGLFVVVGNQVPFGSDPETRVMTSVDGITWTNRVTGFNERMVGVTYSGARFVAVSLSGLNSRVMTSVDGINWTLGPSADENLQWRAIAYGNGLLVAVAQTGSGTRAMSSTDGLTWNIEDTPSDNDWIDIAFGDGVFVVVAWQGTDGQRIMRRRHSDPISFDAPHAPSSLVATADSHSQISLEWQDNSQNETEFSIERSPDGETGWTGVLTPIADATSDTNTGLDANTTYFYRIKAINNDGSSNYSNTASATTLNQPGIDWTPRTSAADIAWRAIAHGDGLFVAVASTAFVANERVMSSLDGITWTIRTAATALSWRAITHGNGLFVAVASDGTGNRVMTSPDGITWTSRTSAADNEWLAVAHGNGLFVAVAGTGTGNRVMTSPDGITWTARTSANDIRWSGITYANGLFVAVSWAGTGDQVMTSPDGITWTIRTAAVANDWTSVAFGNGLFVAVADTGTGDRVMTSPDGITWTSRVSAADNDWSSVSFDDILGLFVAVAYSGTGDRVMTSPDGITWTLRASAADNSWRAVAYGGGMFAAISTSGVGNRVMTSP